jgi:hypothetical protein
MAGVMTVRAGAAATARATGLRARAKEAMARVLQFTNREDMSGVGERIVVLNLANPRWSLETTTDARPETAAEEEEGLKQLRRNPTLAARGHSAMKANGCFRGTTLGYSRLRSSGIAVASPKVV